VQKHVDEGAKFGVSGTPGFFVNGRFLNGALPLETFVQVVEEELGR
jgi:protein-disulfide isomerase